jgi:hypothetical protein
MVDVKKEEYPLIKENKFPRRDEHCIWRIVDNEAVILSEEGKWLHQLNDVGTEIWNMCDGTLCLTEIADKLCNMFYAEEGVIQNDVQSFFAELSKKGLITFQEK